MSAAETVAEVRALGVVITETQGKLWIKPMSRIPAELRARIVEQRDDLVAHIVAERDAARFRLFGPTIVLAGGSTSSTAPCRACGSQRWWRRAAGTHVVCAVCHPPAIDAARVVWLTEDSTDA